MTDADEFDADSDRARRRRVRDGYDALADAYGKSRDPPEAPLVESFLADLSAGSRLLDAGCGQGTPVLDRLPAGVAGVGVDFSVEQLRRARGVTDAALVRGDLTALPVADASVDAVTALHSLIHVPDAQQPAVFAEVARVTRPGARLLVTAGTGPWTGANDDWLGSGVRMEWSFPGVETTRERLGEAGFRVTDEAYVPDELADDGDGEGSEDSEADEDGEDGGGWLFLTAEKRER
ncbi:class I SAM-dependent methyltransferase [Candidatus Halobonum tyrrellensis]|uniref:Type 11 methyltransferase n=1 Tax=Candidatus Halobonum tyrrellensis G22 TaxID=1324957 RepID=V4IZD6_9EURY|nr:class I SAM-dependent methyltransferase [Candidatus Halobonum tyrrellensis]ESP88487.1 type 11 methyltransferase [Candidatus Halobonum tyrrellensis G22]